MASNISSEFEEVHLEEVEHSTSTGSGEEVEIPSGMWIFRPRSSVLDMKDGYSIVSNHTYVACVEDRNVSACIQATMR